MIKNERIQNEAGDKLTVSDIQFVHFLVESGQPKIAYRKLLDWQIENGIRTAEQTNLDEQICRVRGLQLAKKPVIQREYWLQMQKVREQHVADATEVMHYFTQVMRGEIKDQFGLDASLSDRTQAAKELAKRTIDMENRMAGKPDAVVAINLNWKRDRG